MIVSYSELSTFDTCQRQHYYSFVKALQPTELSGPVNTGVIGHKLLQSFYEGLKEGLSKDKAHEAVRAKSKEILSKANIADYGPLLKAWTLVDNYISENEFSATTVLVENRFLIPANYFSADPAFDGVQIGFTPDVVFERTGGFLDVEDSKFVGRAWSQKKLNRFPQAKLYQIFLNHMGYHISRSAIRFFNVETGKITVKPYELKMAEQTVLISDFMGSVRELVEFKNRTAEELDRTRRTMNYNTCQYCFFEVPCSLEAEGKDASKTFKHFFNKRDYDYTR